MQRDFEKYRLEEKVSHFRELSVWPPFDKKFDSDGWLSNFKSEDEICVAERLLLNFTFFNEQMTDALLRASVHNYFSLTYRKGAPQDRRFRKYLDGTAFVTCEGENRNPTDSGNLFARKLRDALNIPDNQIFYPKDALSENDDFERFVFIDDFCGSGQQFVKTWKHKHEIDGAEISFSDLSKQGSHCFAYCCCIAADRARDVIHYAAPEVCLCPAHQLESHHSAIHSDSMIWKDFKAEQAIHTIKKASERAGYDKEYGKYDWRGFHSLGLTLAFEHGIPDASLPIFFSEWKGWKPLMVRK